MSAASKLSVDPAPIVDPRRALLTGAVVEGGSLKAHAAQHVTTDTADVDVLPTVPEVGRTFDHCDVEAMMAELPCGGVAGDACASDQDATAHAGLTSG
ncbi:hypothetical protein [Methylobacterium radiodurans]|uniref:hypothetical protein n=1 Tax=Methylobacterium radiodurans TaxID=2202828 RepID=UPI001FE97793|nr:hypothetical protein [Methylobacterium radiodurans]